jgi:hypothetical protein
MCLIVEIIMTIMGIVALVRGEVKVFGKRPVRGWPAYLIGTIMVSTLPIVLGVSLVVGIILVVLNEGQQANVWQNMPLLAGLEAAVVGGIILTCIILSAIFAKEPPNPALSQHYAPFDPGIPPPPSPPMDPANPYAPPPNSWPPDPRQR